MKSKLKVVELGRVPEDKIGRIISHEVHLESHEYNTVLLLTLYGFDIEFIKPRHSERNNPDILMSGLIWEMKAPETDNQDTIKVRMHKASKQTEQVIFDLRGVKRNYDKIEKYVIKLFRGNRRIRRMILVTRSGRVLDLLKG